MKTAKMLILMTCLVPVRDSLDSSAPPDVKVEVEIVKYDAFSESVKAQRGKVVVVHCWADYSLPDKHMFPNLVHLHAKHERAGIAASSLNLDQEPDECKARVLTFLKARNAAFPNFMLNEDAEVWSRKLNLTPPAVIVFDRAGKLAATIDLTNGPEDPDPLFTRAERVIKKLLAEKQSR